MGCLQCLGDAEGCPLAISYGIDDFAAAVYTVPTGKVTWIRGLPGGTVYMNPSLIKLNAAKRLEELEQ